MVHQCYPDKCFNVGRGRVCNSCKSGYPFTVPQKKEHLETIRVRLFYHRYEVAEACVHKRPLLVRVQCHNNVQRITSMGWELYRAKYLTKRANTASVPIRIFPGASEVERLLKLRSLGPMENGMMLLGIHQCRGSREVVCIPTDPWAKLGRLKRRKHLPDDDTSTDAWYFDRYDQYLERPAITLPIKYPDYYRCYRREHVKQNATSALASNPTEELVNNYPSGDSDDDISADCYRAHVCHDPGEGPYGWPSPPDKLAKKFR